MLKFLQQGPSQQGITASPAAQDSIQARAGKWQSHTVFGGQGKSLSPMTPLNNSSSRRPVQSMAKNLS